MTNILVERIKALSSPLEPIETDIEERLDLTLNPKVIVFDIYGTLFVSGSGDIGILKGISSEEVLSEAMESSGINLLSADAPTEGLSLLHSEIENAHRMARDRGIDYPEVVITEIWKNVLEILEEKKLIAFREGYLPNPDLLKRLSVEYECRVNPVWPMPHAREAISKITEKQIVLGIVSNAQFFTRLLFPALMGKNMEELGFDKRITIFSYEVGRAKPSALLFRLLRETLKETFQIEGNEALYIGNDMLNDIYPAKNEGFRTALFAGDRRSLRLRSNDETIKKVQPDIIIKDLMHLAEPA